MISTSALIADISASKYVQNAPQTSLNSNWFSAENFKYTRNLANVVPLKAEPSVYAWIQVVEYEWMVSWEINFKTFGSVLLFSDGSRRDVLIIGVFSSFVYYFWVRTCYNGATWYSSWAWRNAYHFWAKQLTSLPLVKHQVVTTYPLTSSNSVRQSS